MKCPMKSKTSGRRYWQLRTPGPGWHWRSPRLWSPARERELRGIEGDMQGGELEDLSSSNNRACPSGAIAIPVASTVPWGKASCGGLRWSAAGRVGSGAGSRPVDGCPAQPPRQKKCLQNDAARHLGGPGATIAEDDRHLTYHQTAPIGLRRRLNLDRESGRSRRGCSQRGQCALREGFECAGDIAHGEAQQGCCVAGACPAQQTPPPRPPRRLSARHVARADYDVGALRDRADQAGEIGRVMRQ